MSSEVYVIMCVYTFCVSIYVCGGMLSAASSHEAHAQSLLSSIHRRSLLRLFCSCYSAGSDCRSAVICACLMCCCDVSPSTRVHFMSVAITVAYAAVKCSVTCDLSCSETS